MKPLKRIIAFLVFVSSLGLAACAGPSVSSQLDVPAIPVASRPAGGSPVAEKAFVSLDQIKDGRLDTALAEFRGKRSEPVGEVTSEVQSALESTLAGAGVSVSDSAPLMISAEIRRWFASLDSGMSGGVHSDAELFLQVFDPANKLVYSGSYRGNAMLQQSGIQDKDIRDNLGTAMSEALGQIVKDQKLMHLLASF